MTSFSYSAHLKKNTDKKHCCVQARVSFQFTKEPVFSGLCSSAHTVEGLSGCHKERWPQDLLVEVTRTEPSPSLSGHDFLSRISPPSCPPQWLTIQQHFGITEIGSVQLSPADLTTDTLCAQKPRKQGFSLYHPPLENTYTSVGYP
ncbi:hypothetical protein JOQ06_027857 [Pogonophryne albipinna]|uniref:Uncharacterized protein n=1 Tax=Pogonophryne albipinna TaxID=1090488 RepID=A0AAD6ADJ2_9TELE|nr:hypothetical protein JOQ06_027857 [Pogonophryne albipinna]